MRIPPVTPRHLAHPLPDSVATDWALRWFPPAVEVDLCGHATLATAHALHSDGEPLAQSGSAVAAES